MAAGAWGIDIGQAGLKAIRLEISDATDQVVATNFDYIPHPKILSQPDAIPDELIAQALDKFLKQNQTRGDKLAISVPGQSALARFIQLPPVESSKVSEIVKYEAKQQIPFALEDVVWDYQTLGKGTEESGFLLEAEVGLFAMKREQVLNSLRPFTNAGVEVELIQIAPLALYNFLSFDQLGIRVGDDSVAMDSYSILLDMGADNTTLLVSNGQKIWIRNVPIGGNHFTRALTKEMKLTFAKAEHLKCNATKSPDPRAVFQALRPVFNDYVSEIQRSIGYFSSVNRDAKISKVVGLGNGFKLAGLQKFLQQNLQYDVERVDSFSSISSDGFKDASQFEENILSFPVCYGVALQSLEETRIRTSLLPREITTARTIVRKKPWAVATAAALLAGLSLSAFGYAAAFKTVSKETFGGAEDKVNAIASEANKMESEFQREVNDNNSKKTDAEKFVRAADRRNDWLELYKAITEVLPRDKAPVEDIRDQHRIRIASVQTRWVPDLKAMWLPTLSANAQNELLAEDKDVAAGGGFVVTLTGDHYHDETHNGAKSEIDLVEGRSVAYLNAKLIAPLKQWTVAAADGSGEVGVRSIGITHPAIVNFDTQKEVRNPFGLLPAVDARNPQGQNRGNKRRDKEADGGRGGLSNLGNQLQTNLGNQLPTDDQADPKTKAVQMEKTEFLVQFIWRPEKRPTKPPASATAATKGGAGAQPGAQPAPPKS